MCVLLSVERDQGKGLADHTRNLHDHDALADRRRPTGPSPLSCTVYLDRIFAPRTERTRAARQAKRALAPPAAGRMEHLQKHFSNPAAGRAHAAQKCTAQAYPYAGYATPTRYPRNPYAIRFPQPEKLLEFSGSTREPRPAHPTIRIGPSRAVKRRDATRQSAVDTAGADDSDTTRARTTARQLTRLSTHDPNMHMDILATAQSAEHGPTVTVDFQPTRLWKDRERREKWR